MAESTNIKVGEVYRVRFTQNGPRGLAKVVGIFTHATGAITGVKVEWLDAPRAKTVIMPTNLEPVE